VRTISAAVIGRVMKIAQLPWEMMSDRRSSLSAMTPSTMPSTIAAGEKP